jgi:hypothetical protein
MSYPEYVDLKYIFAWVAPERKEKIESIIKTLTWGANKMTPILEFYITHTKNLPTSSTYARSTGVTYLNIL